MKIDEYRFGTIIIKGECYHKDLILFPDKIMTNWWRKEGHSLSLEDLAPVIHYQPELLVIGTGAYGVMKVPEDLIGRLEQKGIKTEVKDSSSAVSLHNEVQARIRVVTALHLTC